MSSPRSYVTLLKIKQKQSPIMYKPHKPFRRKKDKMDSPAHHYFQTERNRTEKKISQTQRKSLKFLGDWRWKRDKSKNQNKNHEKTFSLQKFLTLTKKQTLKIIVMSQSHNKQEYCLEVKRMGDITQFLSKVHPKISCFKTVPRQLSLEYMLTQRELSGQFLNGQTIHLKPSMEGNDQMKFQNFQIHKMIGCGGFAKVFLCRCKFDRNFYALKLIDKEMIIRNKKQTIIMNERNIMSECSHPFLIEMKFAFETDKYLAFVLELCAGGQLFNLIRKHRRLKEEVAKFYIIEILLGLQYLHKKKVIYRDIKPQNILLDIYGHVKIADLGLAKPEMDEGVLAYSFCGSPEYMSPQMILQVGHAYPVDYYCMGALLYELLTGLPPFYSEERQEIYEAVLSQEVRFPPDLTISPECRNLLDGLLCKDPKKRLGCMHGIREILAHPWFGKKNYQEYLDRKVEPPLNFKTIEKLGFDSTDKKGEMLERVLKDQKLEKKEIKKVMSLFQFDHRLQWKTSDQLIMLSQRQPKTTRKLTKKHLKSPNSPSSIRLLKK